ncbi:MAG: DUF4337 family protein [Deltaproteobacteria bacterium]
MPSDPAEHADAPADEPVEAPVTVSADAPDETHGDEHVDAVARAVEARLELFDARRRAEDHAAKLKSSAKEQLTSRVSIAAIALTMLMSFLGFARTERANAAAACVANAARARADVDARWAYYQTRSSERASYQIADDSLMREAADLPDGDARVRLAEVQHVEYAERMSASDDENRQVLFSIADRAREQVQQTREAARIGRKIDRYDMGTRVLTLAVVLLSVTLLANRRGLFWVALAIAFTGAAFAIDGYFMFV